MMTEIVNKYSMKINVSFTFNISLDFSIFSVSSYSCSVCCRFVFRHVGAAVGVGEDHPSNRWSPRPARCARGARCDVGRQSSDFKDLAGYKINL